MRFSLVCISSIGPPSTMDQSGSQRTSSQFSIECVQGNSLNNDCEGRLALRNALLGSDLYFC